MAATSGDSSALVKRCVAEVGSSWVRRMMVHPAQQVLYTATLTEVEVRSALKGWSGKADWMPRRCNSSPSA
jgi:hypothetical protein